jgi:hypothetical protein
MIPRTHLKVLETFRVTSPIVLGKGREGTVYKLSEEKVLKIFENGDGDFLQALAMVYKTMSAHKLPYQTPLIYSVEEWYGKVVTIEKLLYGQELDRVFPTLTSHKKQLVLLSFLKAIEFYNEIQFPGNDFGQVVPYKATTSPSWTEFLVTRLNQRLQAQPRLKNDVLNYEVKIAKLSRLIEQRLPTTDKALVHADYYLTNVLVNEKLEVSAVIDFGEHAVIGDRKMDVAAAISFLDNSPAVTTDMKTELINYARQKYGASIEFFINVYQLFYGFYFAGYDDEGLYQESLRILNNEGLWDKLRNS